MLCIASFIALLVLSIFSARFRPYVKEAYDCVFRRITFRPCNTGFDVKVRTKITVGLANKSEKIAQFFNKYFELISWIFVISFFVSLAWTLRGGYLFWSTGSCNGLNQGGFCVLDPSGANNIVSGTGIECRTGGNPMGNLTLDNVSIEKEQIVFIGCYACKYSKQTYPLIKKLAKENGATIVYVFYPTHKEAEYLAVYDYAIKQIAADKYLNWVEAMYDRSIEMVANELATLQLIESMGIDTQKIGVIVNDPAVKKVVQKQMYEIDKTGIYGTPTIFINEKPIVGPKPYRVYRIMLTNSLF